jgi:hypothetical protein
MYGRSLEPPVYRTLRRPCSLDFRDRLEDRRELATFSRFGEIGSLAVSAAASANMARSLALSVG